MYRSFLKSAIIFLVLFLLSGSAFGMQEKIVVDLIVNGDYVVTIDDQQPVIFNGAVAVTDGRIVAVGQKNEIAATYDAPQILPGEGMVVMPGLVNGHTHAAMVLFRGLADDKALMDWLQNYIFPAEKQFVDAEFVRIGTQLACWEMIRGGTTTFVDMYFYPDTIARVTEECGLRAIIASAIIDYPSPGFTGWDDSFAAAKSFVKSWQNHPRIIPAIGPHAPYTVSPEHLVQAHEAAKELNVPLVIHVSETQHENDDMVKRYGKTSVEFLNELGVLDSRMIAAHMVWPTDSEIKLLVKNKVGVVHNPGSNLKLASGFAPVPAMLKEGVKIGLGTDGAASNNDLDMWEEIRLAALIHKGNLHDPTVIPAATALRMATLGGAEAIGLAREIGAVTKGRRADLIQVRIGDDAHEMPMYNIISHLVYSTKSTDVATVIVDGKILMQNGDFLTLDRKTISREVKALSQRIAVLVGPR